MGENFRDIRKETPIIYDLDHAVITRQEEEIMKLNKELGRTKRLLAKIEREIDFWKEELT